MRSKMIDFSGVWRSQAADRRSFHGAISRENFHGRLCHVRRTRFATRTTFPQYGRSEEHTSELQSLMRISYAVFCLKKKTHHIRDKLTNLIFQTHKSVLIKY